jgi:hypothetical protein
MAKRICWKKGMRLTDSILRSSDDCYVELLERAFITASSGRFGLLPCSQPFELSINTNKGIVDIETMTCLAITKGGNLIDIHYDTQYTNAIDTRVQIPDMSDAKEFILIVSASSGQWTETNNGYEEPAYSFALIAPNTPIADNAMPVAQLVDDIGWRLDELYFVPPCLSIFAHPRYIELYQKFLDNLKQIRAKVHGMLGAGTPTVIKLFWPFVEQILIATDKERDTMSPMQLLSNVQKCVSAFACACDLDEGLNLSNAEKLRNYVAAPYNYKDAYQRIKEGLDICFSISENLGNLQSQESPAQKTAPTAVPYIADDQLYQDCKDTTVFIPVVVSTINATVFFSTNGSEPTEKLSGNKKIAITTGFKKIRIVEPDKKVIVKLKAMLNGVNSETATYTVTLHKNVKEFTYSI